MMIWTMKTSRKTDRRPEEVIAALREAFAGEKAPSVSAIAHTHRDPFRILISTIISLRTRDEVTTAASERLYAVADTPRALALLPEKKIAETIYPAGFYNTKATQIRRVCSILQREYDGEVPQSLEQLVELPGVGRKTANLVLGLGFGIPAICVDTHVHRISNRLGWVSTATPEATEHALEQLLPRRYWIEINGLFVAFGQRVCTPGAPRCSSCVLKDECPRVGVTRFR